MVFLTLSSLSRRECAFKIPTHKLQVSRCFYPWPQNSRYLSRVHSGLTCVCCHPATKTTAKSSKHNPTLQPHRYTLPTNNMPQSTDVIASNPMAQAPPLVSKSRTNEPNGWLHSFPRIIRVVQPRQTFRSPAPLLSFSPLSHVQQYTKRSNNTQWSEHANVELKSPRRRNCSRFLRTVRRKKSEFYL